MLYQAYQAHTDVMVPVRNWAGAALRTLGRPLSGIADNAVLRNLTAVYELNSALVCRPKVKEQAEIYGELAKAYDKLKQPAMAADAKKYQQQIESSPAFKEPDGPPRGRGHGKSDQGT